MSAAPLADPIEPGAGHGRDLALLWPLLGRRIAFHRRLVDLTRSVKAAVLLSQMIYWTRHGRDIAAMDGWFHKTAAQWELETGLTAREQMGARQVLCELGLLDLRRSGAPAVLHFRLASPRLASLLAQRLGRNTVHLDWADEAVVMDLLGPPLAYHRTLAAIGGGVHAGLLLSRALYLTRYSSRVLVGGWFYAPTLLWARDIGLGRREHESGRRELVRCGIWEEDVRGMPPRIFVRARMPVLSALLQGQAAATERPQRNNACDFPDGDNPTIKKEALSPSRRWDYCQQDSTKPPFQFEQNRHSSLNKTAKLNIHRSTRCLVQTPPPQTTTDPAGAAVPAARGGGELILPDKLLPEERPAAQALASRCPAQAQALLDELAARLLNNTVHTSPIAYLRGMVHRALAGDFVPELGPQVAAARRRKAEEAAQRRQREVEAERLGAEQSTPEYQAAVAARHTQVQQMLKAMQGRKQRGKGP